ncbi:MAG: trypsin-like peptidase domain-containing protein [Clostridia bacterium]|nr:trypsin-like peptidase domain-containing protein [Clostridia bacterium]
MEEWNNDQQRSGDVMRDEPIAADAPEVEAGSNVQVNEDVSVPTAMPEEPYMPPAMYNGVPPYQPPAAPYQPPVAPYYTVPSSPVPSAPQPTPPKKSKGDRAPIIVLSIMCALSVLMMGGMMLMFAVFYPNGSSGGDGQQTTTTTASGDLKGSEQDNTGAANPDAPSVDISETPDLGNATKEADGGLLTSEIVANNLNSTVVLTMYQKNSYGGYFGYNGDELVEVGGATGIIYSADGYIITNSHCVYDEDMSRVYDRLVVTLYNGEEYEAKVAGYDQTTDLAVIKIEATGLTAAKFGDSSKLALGERVVTLGNSGGLEWSASQGIVSGLARDVYEDTGYAIKCLQVDAIINPGSSGGPLFNKYGQVVGINSAKIVSEGYEGLGFSIPINEAKSVIEDLAKYGYVRNRVSLGIMGRTITSIGYEGFYIDSISQDSALAGTAAAKGDIITHVNGVRVMDYAEMRAELVKYNVGDSVTLTLIRLDRSSREVETFTVTVKLQESR